MPEDTTERREGQAALLSDIELQVTTILQKEPIKIVKLLANLELSRLSEQIVHKHPTFSSQSYLKLILYARILGITNYPRLLSNLGPEIILFGLEYPPSKRALNYFKKSKVDLKLIGTIAALILKLYSRLDIVPPDFLSHIHNSTKQRVETDRHRKQMSEAIRLLKRFFYPNITIPIGRNAKFKLRDILCVLEFISRNKDFCNNGCQVLKDKELDRDIPDGDTVLYHLAKLTSVEEIQGVFDRILHEVITFGKKVYPLFRKRRLDIAIDIHKMPYYGDKTDDYVCGDKGEAGTNSFYKFLTLSIVEPGVRFTVSVMPVHPGASIHKLLDEILKKTKREIHLNRVFLDRGFDNTYCINTLKRHHVKFLMPKTKTKKVDAWFDKAEDCFSYVIPNFRMGEGEGQAIANLVLVNDEDGLKRAFITNLDVNPIMAPYLFNLYSQRWGIETGYRNMDHDFRPRTTSKNYCIRLFFFLFTVCLFDLWVLVNLCISTQTYGHLTAKPIITAKRFIECLYSIYVDVG